MNPTPRTLLVAVTLLAVTLAGCQSPDPGPPEFRFNGVAALQFTADLITDENGQPRYRVPGTPGHASAALDLAKAMHIPGWTVVWENFTGAAFEAIPKDPVAPYMQAPYCNEEDRTRFRELTLHNLAASYGSPDPDKAMVVLAAHWDSKAEANQDPDPARRGEPVLGANDGASGVGLILQFMHHVAAGDIQVPFNLGVAFFDAEDGFEDCHPLAGSLYMAHYIQPGDIDRLILLDMVGDPNARFVRESRSVQSDPHLVDLLWQHGQEVLGEQVFTETSKPVIDDHIPFIAKGIPAVDLIDYGRPPGEGISGFPPYWHTTGDTLDKLDATMMGRVGEVLWRSLEDPEFAASLTNN